MLQCITDKSGKMVGSIRRKVAELLLSLLAFIGFMAFLRQMAFLATFDYSQMFFIFDYDKTVRCSVQNTDVYRRSQQEAGFVAHSWLFICGLTSLRKLYQSSFFPKYPDNSTTVQKQPLRFAQNRSYLGLRLSGYLNVPESGYYSFKLNSTGTSELWLEVDVASGLHKAVKSNLLKGQGLLDRDNKIHEIFMEKEQYYTFEVISVGKFVEVLWLKPGSHSFCSIDERYISHNARSYEHEASVFSKEKISFDNQWPIGRYYFVSFIPNWVRDSAIPACKPFTRKEKLQGRIASQKLDLNTKTMYQDLDGNNKDLWKQNSEIKNIVLLYMDGLERIYPLKYRAKRLYKIEKLSPIESRGRHYLIQLEFLVDGLDYTQRVIEYIYQPNSSVICQPLHLKWNRDAVINIILVIQNNGKAIRRFIDMIESVFEKALEVYFHLIIVKYGRSGIDVKAILEKTSLVHGYTVVQMDGTFSRSRGMNKGASLVKGDHDIILALDVDIYIPDTLFEDTRTHCIQGHAVFSPVFFQLECGEDPKNIDARGRWCYESYSCVGIYKTDWETISGMDEAQDGLEEDWSLIQNIQKSGLTIARQTYPGLFRYYTP